MQTRIVGVRHDGADMKRDYLTTFIAEACVLASALLVYRLVALGYGTSGFGEYAVTRRTLTLLLPFAVIGLDIGLARLIAYSSLKRQSDARSYLVAALPIAVTGLALTTGILLAFAPVCAQLFFGDPSRTDLIQSLPILLLGATAHVLVYSNLRGRSLIAQANAVMVGNHAVIPLATFAMSGSLTAVLVALGLGWFLLSSVIFALTPKEANDPLRLTSELLRFGSRRVSGDFVQLLFFALPIMATAQIGGLAAAGIVAFGMTALGMVGSALTPISFVLLPMAARQMESGSVSQLRAHVSQMLRIALPLVFVGVAVLEVFTEPIIELYLGSDFLPAAGALRVLLLGALPWSVFILLRSVVDARHERAINARNLTIAFALFAVLALPATIAARDTVLILASFVLGLSCLSVLTAIESYRALRPE